MRIWFVPCPVTLTSSPRPRPRTNHQDQQNLQFESQHPLQSLLQIAHQPQDTCALDTHTTSEQPQSIPLQNLHRPVKPPPPLPTTTPPQEKMPTPESALFLARKPTVPPTFDGVDYNDTPRLKQAQDAIIREQWVRSMMARLVREELGKCYFREGVNHLEKCGRLRGEFLLNFPPANIFCFCVEEGLREWIGLWGLMGEGGFFPLELRRSVF